MDDKQIVDQLWDGSQQGLDELSRKYGSLIGRIARNILRNEEDAREVCNDTLLRIWDAIPPERPENLLAYTAKTARNLALNRLKFERRQKRDGHLDTLLSELEEFIPDTGGPVSVTESRETMESINRFLYLQPKSTRDIFVRRYFFGDDMETLARDFQQSRKQITDRLYYTRKKLKAFLVKEGVAV